MPALETAMLIPPISIPRIDRQFDETHPTLHQTPRHQTLGSINPRILITRFQAVGLLGGIGFLGDIRNIRHCHLHLKRHLIVRNRRLNRLRVSRFFSQAAIDFGQQLQLLPLIGQLLLARHNVGQDRCGRQEGRGLMGRG